ncbi:hypothetical protein EAO68_22680 [Streptomyces sp. wa22]|nr:hypothetical protein EAO68_22680 [Streptomyces sp. wa22]
MTTRCPFSDPQDPVSRVSNIRGQGPPGYDVERPRQLQCRRAGCCRSSAVLRRPSRPRRRCCTRRTRSRGPR